MRPIVLRILALVFISCLSGSSACNRRPDYRIALVPHGGRHGIFVMNSDTSGGKLITPDPAARLSGSSWSPDGGKIAFYTSRPQDLELSRKYPIPQHYPLYWIHSSGGGEKRLLDFPVSDFEWSPDGRKLLFVSACENPERDHPDVQKGSKRIFSAIYVLDLQSGARKQITAFGLHCSGAWAPGGDRLALSLGTGENSDIYTADLRTGQIRRLTDSGGIHTRPAFSPDGKAIAYLSFGSRENIQDAGVYIIDADGANRKRISEISARKVSWSPDGKWLLIEAPTGIYLSRPEGNGLVDLSQGRGRHLDAAFSPDGRKVLFRSNHEGAWQLYSMDFKGENLKRITYLSASSFCLSPLLSKR